jgi:exodeoxyribonuclease V alpha subunit
MGLNLNKLAAIARQMNAGTITGEAIAEHQQQVVKQPPPLQLIQQPAVIITDENLDDIEIETAIPIPAPDPNTFNDRFGNIITYNSKQMEFVSLAGSGADCVLIGAAGTGKTTCMKGVVNNLILSGIAGVISSEGMKYLRQGTPGIVVVAFTRRAVNNIRRNMPEDMKDNCVTIHKLLEYEPVFYEVIDPQTHKIRNKVEFRPARNEMNPIHQSVHTIVFEEGSMVGTELYGEVEDAMLHEHQEIFLGDIQQLPPVFGPAILGFKLLSLPVVELTEVYRQALESPIIRLAHRILSGKVIPPAELKEMQVPGQLTIKPWSKTILASAALTVLGNNLPDRNGHLGLFPGLIASGGYDPEQDMILIPQNVGLGTIELNNYIAQYIAHSNNREVWEVIAGFNKHYFSIGDKVMYERADGIITAIEPNSVYAGSKLIRAPSKTLTYWGMETARTAPSSGDSATLDNANFDVDFALSQVAMVKDEDRVNSASHRITIKLFDSDTEITIDKAGQVNNTILGYALTVHKAQGSEWRKVFLVFHKEHNRMLQRELLYTAVTRAREELVIICELNTFIQGIESQKIKGNTLAEKAEHFKGKQKQDQLEIET